MNRAITIKQSYSKPINLGLVLEALLFYDKVNLVVDSKSLESIIYDKSLISYFINWVRSGVLVFYLINAPYAILGLGNNRSKVNFLKFEDKFLGVLYGSPVLNESGFYRNLLFEFWDLIKYYPYEVNRENLNEDIKNESVFRASINSVIEYYIPNINDVEKKYLLTERRFENTNKDIFQYELVFEDKLLEEIGIEGRSTLETNPISAIVDVNINLEMSTKFNSDFLSQTIYDSLLRFKIYQIFNKFPQYLETKQKLFQEINVNKFKSIEFAINNKLRTLDEFKDLYQDGAKFRKWLSSIDEDNSLTNEYYKEVGKQKWFEKLPVKSVKWALFTGAGIAIDIMGAGGLGTAGGIVLSASDEFYLNKLLTGWKPNLFIQGELNEFLNRK